jgi:hypothetical protein
MGILLAMMLYHPDLQRMNNYRDTMYQDNKFLLEVGTEKHVGLLVSMMMMMNCCLIVHIVK